MNISDDAISFALESFPSLKELKIENSDPSQGLRQLKKPKLSVL
jgi:hypothetical protein